MSTVMFIYYKKMNVKHLLQLHIVIPEETDHKKPSAGGKKQPSHRRVTALTAYFLMLTVADFGLLNPPDIACT